MKEERDKGVESAYRSATVQENLERFQYMLDTRKREEEEKKKGAKPAAVKKQEEEKKEEEEMKQVKSV
jgi:hypothetical protein